jgi:hypothetical protein
MKIFLTFLFAFLFVMWSPTIAQNCTGGGAASVVTLDLTNRNSVRLFDHNLNERGTLTAGFAGDVVAVNFSNVNLNTFGGSWCEEAELAILDARNSSTGVIINFSDDQNGSPCSDLPFTGFFDLVGLALEFPTGAGNSIYWELYETVNDIAGADATYTSGTATIYVCPTGESLPVELLSFTGKAADNSNLLAWETASERNVSWHIVERSSDGLQWSEIGRKTGLSVSNTRVTYELTDQTPLPKAFYRLKSLDADGKFAYSSVISVVRPNTLGILGLFAYPNPTQEILQVDFVSEQEAEVRIWLTDAVGRIVLEQFLTTAEGAQTITLPVSHLALGSYTLSMAQGQAKESIRVLKQ